MELDLSKLDTLWDHSGDPERSEGEGKDEGAEGGKNDSGSDMEGLKGVAMRKLEKQQTEDMRVAEIHREYQENIARSGRLRAEIIKGAREGEDPRELLLKAVECIGLMTGDRVLYETVKRRMGGELSAHPY